MPAKPKPKRTMPAEVLSSDEARVLIDACDARSFTGIRNRALIGVMYRAGLRVSEALSLAPKDLDLEVGAIRVLRAKGGRARTVGVDRGGAALLRDWIVRRADATDLGRGDPLFCTDRGEPLTPSYIRVLLPRLARRAGIDKRVHPHGLRHTHAAELRAEGLDVGVISRQLGHASLLTTIRYLDHIAPTAVVEAMGARRW